MSSNLQTVHSKNGNHSGATSNSSIPNRGYYPGTYAWLDSPSFRKYGRCMLPYDLVAAWGIWDWQQIGGAILTALLAVYCGYVRNPQEDVSWLVNLRMLLVAVLACTWLTPYNQRSSRVAELQAFGG